MLKEIELTCDDPDRVLTQARGKLENCIVLGFEKEDGGFYMAGSSRLLKELTYLVKLADAQITSYMLVED